MKIANILIALIFTLNFSLAQDLIESEISYPIEYYDEFSYDDYITDYNFYSDSSAILQTFKQDFENDTDKNDFKKLRDFKNAKERKLDSFKKKLFRNENFLSNIKSSMRIRQRFIDRQMASLKSMENMISNRDSIEYSEGRILLQRLEIPILSKSQKIPVETISKYFNDIKGRIREAGIKLKEDSTYFKQARLSTSHILTSINNLEEDIKECIAAIDEAIAPEYKIQNFRTQISITFSILIGVLIMTFFFLVYKRSDSSLSKILLNDSGLQFVTIFVLIIAITLFGILNILEGKELAAILSGIAGYILGKSSQQMTINKPNTEDKPPTS